jgi:DNA (cytosine-5)-methyltransferase 1
MSMMRTYKYGSLCTGYDGMRRGLSLARVDTADVFCAEVEPSVAALLTSPNLGDIKTVDWTTASPVELLSSGDPCQSVSVAGRREGRADPRFLWPWVREAYRALRPERIFLENVQGIVSHDGGRTLAERFENLTADGYSVRWLVAGACAVGAPHHRHRWYALAEKSSALTPAVKRVAPKALCGAPRSGGRTLLPTPMAADGTSGPGKGLRRMGGLNLRTAVTLLPTPCARDGESRGEGDPAYWLNRFATRPDRVGKGIPLGAAVNLLPTPTVTNQYGNGFNNRRELLLPDVAASLLPTPRATDGTNGGPSQRGSSGDLAMGAACQPQHWGKYADAITLWEDVTGVSAPAPTVPGPKGGVRLNPELPEWMMGLEPGTLTDHMARNDALKAAGNGVVPQQAAAAWRLLAGND